MNNINDELFELYSTKWSALNKIMNDNELEYYEYNPLLLNIDNPNEYKKSDLRVMIFGQDMSSGDWYKYDRKKNDLRHCMQSIKSFRNECGAIDLKSEKLQYKGMGGGINFFIETVRNYFPDKKIQFVWNDIVKMGRNIKSNTKRSLLSDIEYKYFNVIIDEIRILQPEIIVFFTGPSNYWESELQNKLGISYKDYIEIENISKRELSIINLNNNILNVSYAFRTYHPCARIGKRKYYNTILEISKRNMIFNEVNLNIKGCNIHYVDNDIDKVILNRTLNQEWAFNWVNIGVIRKSYYICICWGLEFDMIEIGIRKAPNSEKEKLNIELIDSSYEKSNNQWWYYRKLVSKNTLVCNMINELKYLNSLTLESY